MNRIQRHLLLLPQFFICFALLSCDQVFPEKNSSGNSFDGRQESGYPLTGRDTSINDSNAFSELSLDSAALEEYISSHDIDGDMPGNIRAFYAGRNYHFAWFTDKGLSQEARAFWNLHNNYLKAVKDSSLYDKALHERMDALHSDEEEMKFTSAELQQTELHLTQHFFKYAKDAYEGAVDPSDLQWHIPRKKLDVVALLDSLFQHNEKQLKAWEPVNHDYQLLKNKLKQFYSIEKRGGFIQLDLAGNAYRKGDSAGVVKVIKERLRQSGDFQENDTTHIYTRSLADAVIHAQKRLGLKPDGVVGPVTAGELNIPAKQRIEQILVNMERMKWMPDKDEAVKLVANIPDFTLQVYQDGQAKFDMKIVVGKAGHNSVVFSDKLEYVVFSPYWNIPSSIVRDEILPKMRKNTGYLWQNNMEQTGTRNGLPVIRQKPGGENSLGRVKFIFPNNYNIYFHDTPAKSLFDLNDRAFSHGCIRLEQPQRLAAFLLRNNDAWTDAKISNAMYEGEEDWVKLEKTVPVYILYYTAWVDDKGEINFRKDIYGHDEEMKARMFED